MKMIGQFGLVVVFHLLEQRRHLRSVIRLGGYIGSHPLGLTNLQTETPLTLPLEGCLRTDCSILFIAG